MKRFWVGILAILTIGTLLIGALAELAFEDAANEDMMATVRSEDVKAAALDLSLLNGQEAGTELIAPADANDGETIDINEKNFPDEAFRGYVSSEYAGGEATVDRSVLEAVKSIDVSDKGIADMKGIAFFTGLEQLNCRNNSLTVLDLTQNTNLIQLNCAANDRLAKLDVSGCGKLGSVDLDFDDVLKTLNARNCVALTSLLLYDGKSLANVDLNGCSGLTELYCGSSKLSSINLKGCTALKTLTLEYSQLKSFDASPLKALEELKLHANKKLGSLNVRNNKKLLILYCEMAKLKSLDVTRNTQLEELYCYENSALSSLNVSKCTKLERLVCRDSKLTSLNLSKNKQLRKLNCANNKLTSLDVSKCPSLNELYCAGNKLKKLTLGKHENLEELACDHNALKRLDLSGCPIIRAEITCVISALNKKEKTVEWGDVFEGETGIEAFCRFDRKTTLTDGKAVLYKPGNPKTIKFTKSSVAVKVGREKNLGYLLDMQPTGTASVCTFTSTNEKVAVADEYGYVRGVGKGTCTITVKTANGLTASIEVNVKR